MTYKFKEKKKSSLAFYYYCSLMHDIKLQCYFLGNVYHMHVFSVEKAKFVTTTNSSVNMADWQLVDKTHRKFLRPRSKFELPFA